MSKGLRVDSEILVQLSPVRAGNFEFAFIAYRFHDLFLFTDGADIAYDVSGPYNPLFW